MTVVSNVSGKTFDDTLEDLGGVALFDPSSTKFTKNNFPFLRKYNAAEWETLGRIFYGMDVGSIYVRFVDPSSERFGSIARIYRQADNYYSFYNPSYTTPKTQAEKDQIRIDQWNRQTTFTGEMRWDKRSNKPEFYSYSERVEWLPNYKGETVWAYDKERRHRVNHTIAFDKLGREINVGDFCTYILYHFEGRSAASVCFGTVTDIEKDGTVWAKNVSLKTGSPVAEKRIKDNNLITILTDDLMQQLMLARLSNG